MLLRCFKDIEDYIPNDDGYHNVIITDTSLYVDGILIREGRFIKEVSTETPKSFVEKQRIIPRNNLLWKCLIIAACVLFLNGFFT